MARLACTHALILYSTCIKLDAAYYVDLPQSSAIAKVPQLPPPMSALYGLMKQETQP